MALSCLFLNLLFGVLYKVATCLDLPRGSVSFDLLCLGSKDRGKTR